MGWRPVGLRSNQTAAFLAQFAMFLGVAEFVKRRKYKLICYGLVATTICDHVHVNEAYAAIPRHRLTWVLKDRNFS
jgi:hypothetical protein